MSEPRPVAAQTTPIIRGAQPGRVVGMRVVQGDVPEFGDVLELASGKRYQVIEPPRGRNLRALVLKPTDVLDPGTRVWEWRWMPRKNQHGGF